MPSTAVGTPVRRDGLLALVALVLLLFPVWVAVANVSENTYYRVSLADRNDPGRIGSALGVGLSIAGPVAGLYIGFGLVRRLEISYESGSSV